MAWGKDNTDSLERDLSDALRRPTIVERIHASDRQQVVQMRAAANQRSPLNHTACWMRSLRYEDMMQMATEMHGIKDRDSVDTPEQLAKLLHAWAKVTTEPPPEVGQ